MAVLGQVVEYHYGDGDTKYGEADSAPAMVLSTFGGTTEGAVNLRIFTDSGSDEYKTSVPYKAADHDGGSYWSHLGETVGEQAPLAPSAGTGQPEPGKQSVGPDGTPLGETPSAAPGATSTMSGTAPAPSAPTPSEPASGADVSATPDADDVPTSAPATATP